jgi:hypothetical protein
MKCNCELTAKILFIAVQDVQNDNENPWRQQQQQHQQQQLAGRQASLVDNRHQLNSNSLDNVRIFTVFRCTLYNNH